METWRVSCEKYRICVQKYKSSYTYNIQLFNYRGSILEEVLLSVISNERIVFNLKPHNEGPTMSTMEASSVCKARKNAARRSGGPVCSQLQVSSQ